jgi:Family of unknown function (DUF6507)
MSRWDIDPAGVRGVVSRTIDTAKGFEEQARSYEQALGGAAEASGSQIVGQALVDFAAHNQPAFQFLVDRTSRVLEGAVDATRAYLNGDLAMAEHAQRNAGR